MKTKRIAEALVRRFQTRNPYKIAEGLGIIVKFVPLHGIRGFYQYINRCGIIYIDESLSEWDAGFVCAHELGHALLHKGYNRVFMDTHAFFKVDKYEIEADHFAVNLRFSDDDVILLFDFPTEVVAYSLGVSTELAEYRMSMVA